VPAVKSATDGTPMDTALADVRELTVLARRPYVSLPIRQLARIFGSLGGPGVLLLGSKA
jgi:hypothetical protein